MLVNNSMNAINDSINDSKEEQLIVEMFIV